MTGGWLARHRARREFEEKLRITHLENAVGVELSYPELDLPTVRVVPNPNDSLGWRPWVAIGFSEWVGTFDQGYIGAHTYASSRRICVRKARARLLGIALAKVTPPVEVEVVP